MQYLPVARKSFRRMSARVVCLLATLLFWPTVSTAVPILGEQQVMGWANERGNFVVDFDSGSSVFGAGDAGVASYSTAASVFSFSAPSIAVCGDFPCTIMGPANIRLNAIVQETGTVSGDLIAGILTATAGAGGFPEAGIAPGELLFVGNAIEAAAVNLAFSSTSFLFEVTYANSALSDLAHYLTFWGAWSPSFWTERDL